MAFVPLVVDHWVKHKIAQGPSIYILKMDILTNLTVNDILPSIRTLF